MATIITGTPSQLNPVNNSICFKIQSNDLGSGTVKKRIIYYIEYKDLAGTIYQVTEINTLEAFSVSQIITLDVNTDIASYLKTIIPTIPSLSSPQTFTDLLILGSVRIRVGTAVTDLETCDTTLEWDSYSAWFEVINSVIQEYEVGYLNFGIPQILDHRPDQYCIDRDAFDFVWVYGTTSVTYTPDIGTPITINGSGQVNVFTMSAYGPTRETMKYMDVTFNSVMGGRTIRVCFTDICCEGWESRNILYLDPRGGRHMMSFDYLDEHKFNSEQEIICRYQGCGNITSVINDYPTNVNSGGDTIFHKRNSETITLVKTLESCNKDQLEYLKSFLGSAGYHIQVQQPNGPEIMFRKFIVDSGSILYNKYDESIDLVISGRMAHEYKTHLADR